MTLINGHSRILTMLLLLVQLSLPLSGPLYISNLLGSIEESHTGFVCTHADYDAGHEPQEVTRALPIAMNWTLRATLQLPLFLITSPSFLQ